MPASVHSEEAHENDQSMMDAEMEEPVNPILLDEKRVIILPGSTDTAASFQFEGEGHTLGNALRYTIMKNPAVEFCGYTIPHPSDAKMHVRIQTDDTTTALEALEKGFDDLMDLCDVVTEKFTVARDQYKDDAAYAMEG